MNINLIKVWKIFDNTIKKYAIPMALIFFVIMLLIATIYRNSGTLSVLAASFGSIFVALKYKLDQANYHKDLFQERYAILMKLDEILFDFLHGEDWRSLKEKLDSIYRKSYCLFSDNTYQFIDEFGKAIIDASMLKDSTEASAIEKVRHARKFLGELLDGQNLSKKFPEMKIDTY